MAGKKPRGRGVLASLLRMTNEKPQDNGGYSSAPPHLPEQIDEAAPAPISPEMRESYEPGWYRISMAQPSDDTGESGGHEVTAAPEPVSQPPADDAPTHESPSYETPAHGEMQAYEPPAVHTPPYETSAFDAVPYEAHQPTSEASSLEETDAEANYQQFPAEVPEESPESSESADSGLPPFDPPQVPVYEEPAPSIFSGHVEDPGVEGEAVDPGYVTDTPSFGEVLDTS